MTTTLRVALDTERDRHATEIQRIADQRLADLAKEWRRQRSKQPLKIGFAMGTEIVYIGGEVVHDFPQIVGKALEDIWDITDSYRIACPETLEVQV